MTEPNVPAESLFSRVRAWVPRPVKAWIRGLGDVPARLGHARRRRRATAALPDGAGIQRVLVLCHGNICRSPYVAARLRRLWPDVAVESAGFLRGGRPSPPEALEAAERRGISLQDHESRQIQSTDLGAVDLIIVMEPGQQRDVAALVAAAADRTVLLGELDPAPFQPPAVPDPWGQPPATFDRCFARLDRCTDALVARLRERAP